MFEPRSPYPTQEELDAGGLRPASAQPPQPGTELALIPRDPEIRPQPGEAEPSDKIELFGSVGGSDTMPQPDEIVRKRHATLMASLDEEAERQAEERQQAQIDDDYYHHQQWRPDEARVLQERGQAPLVFNEARGAIDWLVGTERRLRKDYKIRPRSREDEPLAEVKTKLFKYTDDVNLAPWHRSKAFKQMATSGLGWLEEGLNSDPEQEMIWSGSEDWRRVFRDSRAREFDLSDCRYLHRRKLLDLDYAIALLPKGAAHLRAQAGRWGTEDDEADETWYLGQKLTSAHASSWAAGSDSLYGDDYTVRRAGHSLWDHGRRNSVEILESWYRVPELVKVFNAGPLRGKILNPADPAHTQALSDRWNLYETVKMRMRCMLGTKHQPIWDGASPYRHGRFPLIPMWGYRRGRDGMVYGQMRGMRDPQDDLNKRRSKALFALSASRTILGNGAVKDVEDVREEMARVDAVLNVTDINQIRIEKNEHDFQGNMHLAQADIEAIRNSGGVTGENLGQHTNAASGKAIIAKQEQGSLITYELFDNYFLAFKLAGQIRMANIEQFCNQEWTLRIDPQGNKPPEWVTVNQYDERTGQYINDITRSQADFIVDQQDYRATLTQTAMQAMFELLGQIATFAPQVVLNLMDLMVDTADIPGKDEWVARIRKMTGQRDPSKPPTPEEQQQDAERAAQEAKMQAITLETAEAKLKEILSKVNNSNADKVLKKLQSLLAAVEAAATIATMPGVAQPADELAKAAGFEDETPANDVIGTPPNPAPGAALAPPDAAPAGAPPQLPAPGPAPAMA